MPTFGGKARAAVAGSIAASIEPAPNDGVTATVESRDRSMNVGEEDEAA